ncbi:MAG: F0F1 ATP synthase subunit alpha [Candidatus Lambdaproteobacteria bacterium]|nr:F0F1 ATP synthase subunit alpha [Candidatus Lambdaproteobacteria bacterium]
MSSASSPKPPPAASEPTAPAPLLARQAGWVARYRVGARWSEQGLVGAVGDGIAWIKGLPSAAMEELIEFADGSLGLTYYLGPTALGAMLLTQSGDLAAGQEAFLTGRRLGVGVGDALLGRVIDPLGRPHDGLGPLRFESQRDLDTPAPPIIRRDFVSRPLYTGHKLIDTMIPIGRGQRQLLIGDNSVGKTSLALDIVVNQRGQDVRCVYVLVGQKNSSVLQALETLKRCGAMDYTVVVVAEATALPGLKYLAPFAGCTVAEYWMEQGRDCLVIFDDLTTHARTFRELSLLLRRPPGREAYPADIFYLHSRLLERATCLAREHGGGSLTALPIVETKLGELATYIPTNLISITDGQVYLDQRLFASGFRPAIDVTRSVSRIGGKAQHPRIKEAAGRMKLDYLQFIELEIFTRFGSRLETTVEQKIRRGRVLREVLKQERLQSLPIEFQLAWMTAFNEGMLDAVAPEAVPALLRRIAAGLAEAGLTLNHSRHDWSATVRRWLPTPGGA